MKSESAIQGPDQATPPGVPRRSFFSHPVAWAVLAISLLASAGGWFIAWKNAELRARKRFDEAAGGIAAKLTERMQIYEDVLHGALGLFSASYSVERGEWRAYLRSVSIEKRFPGINGVGFVAFVPREKLEHFLKVTRADKTPGFEVKTNASGSLDGRSGVPAARDDLLVVKYIEPEERLRAMLGQNLGTDIERRAVAERSRDAGVAALSGALSLQDSLSVPQEGCMMMLPVYRNGMPAGNLAERRAAIEGWVFARFIMTHLMEKVMGGERQEIHLFIYDAGVEAPAPSPDSLPAVSPPDEAAMPLAPGTAGSPGSGGLVFDSDAGQAGGRPQSEALFTARIPVRLGGREWILSFATKPAFEATSHRGASLWVAAAGTLISLLLFGIAWSLSHTRERALAMAANMTQTLRDTNKRLDYERYLLRTLMDNLPEHIYFKDRQSRFLRNSRAHLRIFGLTRPEDAVGKTDFDFFAAEHAQEAYEDEQRVMKTGEPLTKEEKETWPDGAVTWVLSTKMPLRDESGETVGTFGISRDITDSKRAEEALRAAKEAAEEASRTKSHFLASMSHELRTQLNSVIGFANILLKNKAGNLGSTELNFLDRIQANGKHLLALINEILDLSKIEARKVQVEAGPVALDVLVRETIAQQEGLVRDKPVRLVADLPAQVAPLLTDGERLKQILINLIGNALKFTEQGSVTVRVVTDPADHQPVRLEVIDTGIGIPKDKLGLIFEAFQQAEAGTARKYGGTGLGLTISQALCQLLGFRIEVASEVGRGSTFSVHLGPHLKSTPAPVPAGEPARDPSPPTGCKGKLVLVIDDELDSRTLLTHAIEEFGCQAIAAGSGEQGLRMAREFLPNLITVDLMMPQLDGWQVISAIKADPALRDIPVVVVSIVAGEHKGRILGAVEVLQKPVARADLLAVLHRCLPSKTPRVLIVDDEEDTRRMLAAYLEDEPCEFRTAGNGRAALELMETFPPDLVLLDLMMPVMDGMTFLNHIRSTPRFLLLPVVIVTARELSASESYQLRQTVADVVKKGDTFEADLARILRRYLRNDIGPEPARKS